VTRRSVILPVLVIALAGCGQHPGVHEEGLREFAVRGKADAGPRAETTPAGVADAFTDGEGTSFDSGRAVGAPGPASGSDRASVGLSLRRSQRTEARITTVGGTPLPAGARTRSVRIGEGQGVVEDVNGDRVPDTGSLVILIRGDGPLYTCPLWGRGYYNSSFGAFRPGPPIHPHAGNDIVAPFGTPIVAPFDGRAVGVTSALGGLGVKVFGADGYVYNAHLSAYGKLGDVTVGDVIGFVGDTGNAQLSVPHNHFEWHPAGGPAVDPFPYLNEVCT